MIIFIDSFAKQHCTCLFFYCSREAVNENFLGDGNKTDEKHANRFGLSLDSGSKLDCDILSTNPPIYLCVIVTVTVIVIIVVIVIAIVTVIVIDTATYLVNEFTIMASYYLRMIQNSKYTMCANLDAIWSDKMRAKLHIEEPIRRSNIFP